MSRKFWLSAFFAGLCFAGSVAWAYKIANGIVENDAFSWLFLVLSVAGTILFTTESIDLAKKPGN